jgi:regulation of enolase protein 1 (concanavalin A-like superfamily)
MSTSRRIFMQHSMAAALLASTAGSSAQEAVVPGKPPLKPWLEGSDLVAKLEWFNPPASAAYDAGAITVKSRPRTDFWRKTFYGYVTDNGHFFRVPVFGEFTFQARVNGKYAALYDQAGLMVRLDEKRWMKCGSEFVDGRRSASVVFTHEFSDWSTTEDLSQSEPVFWRVERKKDSIEAQYSKDGLTFTTIRQGYFPAFVEAQVGVMCAAPEGAGFEAVFDDLRLYKP